MIKFLNKITPWIFIFFTVFSTLAVDVKLTRYKLFAMELAIIILVIAWMLKIAYYGEMSFKRNILNLPVLLYGILISFFYIMSNDKAVAKPVFESSIFCMLIFYGTTNCIVEDKDRITIIKAWYVAAIFLAIHGIGSYIAANNPGNFITGMFSGVAGFLDSLDKTFHLPIRNFFGFAYFDPNTRPFTTFGNPNFYAAYLVTTIPVFMALALVMKRKFIVLNFIILCLLLFNLWIAASRGAWLGFTASVVLFIVLLKPNLKKLAKSKNMTAVWSVLLLALVFILIKGGFVREFIQVAKRPTERLLIWRDTLVMGLKNPLGVGIGAYHIYFPKYASGELISRLPQDKFIVNYTHNEFLQVFSETGIAGLIFFIWLIFAFFRAGINQLKSLTADDRNICYLTAGFLSSGAGILIQDFFSVSIRFIVEAIYLYFIMGMMASCGKHRKLVFRAEKDSQRKLIRILCWIIIIPFGIISLSAILQPFAAHKQFTEEVGFFEQKVVSPDETIDKLNDAIDKNPKDAELHYKLGWVYAKEKNWSRAIEHFEEAAILDPQLEGPCNNLGNIYFLTGNRNKAIENYKKSIAINPNKVDAHFNLGYIYYMSGKLKEASDEFKKILELDPKNYKATIMLEKMVQ